MCHKYWPGVEVGVGVYGGVHVQLQEELFLSDHTIRTFTLQHDEVERVVKQFHFTAWPDFGIPENPTSLLQFIRKVSKSNQTEAGPMIIHCRYIPHFPSFFSFYLPFKQLSIIISISAGVGRTGTFITIMCQMKQIFNEQSVDILNFVQAMLHQRCFMVQTEAQYMFIHDALLEVIECGQTEVAAREVKDRVM